MSITVNYFFNYAKPLAELVEELRTGIGCDLRPNEGDPDNLRCRLLGMEFSLGTHRLSRDGDLDFESFRYKADIRTPLPDADFRPHQITTMTSLAHAMYRRLRVTGLLVFDVQRLLARYHEQADPTTGEAVLYDVVSAEPVRFPQHWTALLSRLPEGALGAQWEASAIEYLKSIGRTIRVPRRGPEDAK